MQLALYDVLGREVAGLAEGSHAAGDHAVPLDAAALPAGVYVLRLRVGEAVLSRRVTLLR